MAIQWQRNFYDSQTAEVTIEMTDWAGRFAYVYSLNDDSVLIFTRTGLIQLCGPRFLTTLVA